MIRTFKTDVFTGLSIESKVENLDSLLNLGEISQAWPSTNIALAPPDFTKLYAEQSTANYSVHWATGVEQAHSAGYFGKGVTIAIVDTGVDYTHPAVSFVEIRITDYMNDMI